jgi:acyl carrier protein
MNTDQAREIVGTALLRVVPDADVESVDPDADLRDELELDSLDFLAYIEALHTNGARRIDEDDYPSVRTLRGAVAFLVGTEAAAG